MPTSSPQRNIGKQYSFGLKKMIGYYPNSYRDNTTGKEKDPDAYFCSELIAKYYKDIGLLPQSKPASAYWPSKQINFID